MFITQGQNLAWLVHSVHIIPCWCWAINPQHILVHNAVTPPPPRQCIFISRTEWLSPAKHFHLSFKKNLEQSWLQKIQKFISKMKCLLYEQMHGIVFKPWWVTTYGWNLYNQCAECLLPLGFVWGQKQAKWISVSMAYFHSMLVLPQE